MIGKALAIPEIEIRKQIKRFGDMGKYSWYLESQCIDQIQPFICIIAYLLFSREDFFYCTFSHI